MPDKAQPKYEYVPTGVTVPCARLIDGQSGIIQRVDFYKQNDFAFKNSS